MLRKLMSKKRDNKGFTLVELIVVIAIIAVLLALAVPRLIGYTETARVRSDDQLMALYRNTFNISLGSGTLANRNAGNVVITVVRDGTISYSGTNYLTDVNLVTGVETDHTDNTRLTAIQTEFIMQNAGAVPSFRSNSYLNGITITITPANGLTVIPTP